MIIADKEFDIRENIQPACLGGFITEFYDPNLTGFILRDEISDL